MSCLLRVDAVAKIKKMEVVETGMVNKSDAEVPAKMTRFVVTMDDEPAAFKPSVKSRLGPRVMTSSSTSEEQLDAREILLAKREQITPTRMQITLGDSLGDDEDEGANGLRDPFVDLEEVGNEEQSDGKKPDGSNIPR